jgi:hypothetical protein
MAFGPELIARLGLDATGFQRGLSSAVNSAGGLGKALNRKVGTQDAFKGLVAAFGISIENISEKIAEAWVGGTRRGLEQINDLYDREAELIRESIFDRLPDDAARQKFIATEIDKTQKEIAAPRKTKTELQGGTLGADFKVRGTREVQVFTETQEEQELRVAKGRVRLLELQRQQNALTKKGAQETAQLDKQVEGSREKRLQSELDAAGKVSYLTGKQAAAEMAVEQAAEGSEERKRAQIALDEVSMDLAAAKKNIEEEINKTKEDNAKLDRDQTTEKKKQLDDARRLRDAEEDVGETRKKYEAARGDAYKVSIQEAASGEGGVSATNRARAREILRMEDRARRIFQGQGGNSDFRDPTGNRVSAEDYAKQLQSRAEGLRESSGFLKSADSKPFEAQLQALNKAEQHLAEIKAALTQEAAK